MLHGWCEKRHGGSKSTDAKERNKDTKHVNASERDRKIWDGKQVDSVVSVIYLQYRIPVVWKNDRSKLIREMTK